MTSGCGGTHREEEGEGEDEGGGKGVTPPPPPGSGGEQSLCLKQKPPVLPPSLSLSPWPFNLDVNWVWGWLTDYFQMNVVVDVICLETVDFNRVGFNRLVLLIAFQQLFSCCLTPRVRDGARRLASLLIRNCRWFVVIYPVGDCLCGCYQRPALADEWANSMMIHVGRLGCNERVETSRRANNQLHCSQFDHRLVLLNYSGS